MKKSIARYLLRICLATAVLVHGTSAFACACCFEREIPETFTLGLMHPDYEAPFANHQAKGVLAILDDTAKNISSEGMGVTAKSPKMPFIFAQQAQESIWIGCVGGWIFLAKGLLCDLTP